MHIDLTDGRLTIRSDTGRVAVSDASVGARFSDGSTGEEWIGAVLTADGDGWVTTHRSNGLRVELRCRPVGGGVELSGRLVNGGTSSLAVDRFILLTTGRLEVGVDPRRWRMYRNGFQSWAGTWTIGVDESDRDLPGRFARTGATDARHPSPTGPGHVRSDALSAIVEPISGDALAVGFTTLADAFGFVELDAPHGRLGRFQVWVDLDSTTLAPGETTPWHSVRIVAASDDRSPAGPEPSASPTQQSVPGGAQCGTRALREVALAAGAAMNARTGDGHHPSGWCSWYYYFTKVTEADVDTNLAVLAADGPRGPQFRAEYVMVDDGHQRAIGDWLSTNEKFPSGMAAVASRITDAGFDAGIWWAPFIVSSKSEVAQRHPDWLVRNRRGRPVLGLINPGWGVTTPMWVLDTTHPEVIEHLRSTAATIGHEWGYRIQKIDFLYAAALEGVRFDPTATRAQALRRGLEAVRAGAGPEAFILGCGCPLGPAVGVVDAMRIGADVTPSWTTLVGRTVGRERHALATAHALLNTLSRSVVDGAWFLNDPDCLMVRDRDTTLTLDEVRLMCTVFGMTDGMVVLSDRMDQLPPERQALVARTHDLAGGTPEVVDLFERALPELLVSRHSDHVDVALINLTEQARLGRVDLSVLGVAPAPDRPKELTEFWSGQHVDLHGSILDVGVVDPHAAMVVRIPLTEATRS